MWTTHCAGWCGAWVGLWPGVTMDQPQRNGIRHPKCSAPVAWPERGEGGRNCQELVIFDPHPLTHSLCTRQYTLTQLQIPLENKLKAIKVMKQIIESMSDKGAG